MLDCICMSKSLEMSERWRFGTSGSWCLPFVAFEERMRPLLTQAIFLALAVSGFMGVGGHDKTHGEIRAWNWHLIHHFDFFFQIWTVDLYFFCNFSTGDLQTYAFSDTETKFNMADGYVFFEIVEPEVSVLKKFLKNIQYCTGFSHQGRAKLRVGVLNDPRLKNSKPLEVERNQKAHHNKTPLSSCASVLNLFLIMFTHLSNGAYTFLGTFPLLGT